MSKLLCFAEASPETPVASMDTKEALGYAMCLSLRCPLQLS